ncbi:hypothetical protein [Parasphaerochaeta coccoides]|uniref:Uncharacterized protein n=1 Tax=Parasphaerochaeta coccoides (strain ATCC BAA-1237 / DSM 17374 / SPN1) TaxID=760011 RepID=F4GHF2_PARC1|nr:hypothetical protein [Parasphaerochaeta coccoides]AEC02051.1 hypothetical protein Spico_0827 [Parasphaerochaeta coccoides DSM 17374]
MQKTINGVMYDMETAMCVDEFCIGRTTQSYLWQLIMVSPEGEFFLVFTEANSIEELYPISAITEGEIIALTKGDAKNRLETKHWQWEKGRFNEFIAAHIKEFLEEQKENQ